MKAIVQDRYGSPDVLRLKDIDRPVVEDDGVLVRVRAASVNIGDWHFVTGTPYILRMAAGLWKPKQVVPGVDAAGQVEAVGAGVTRFRPGDEVFGWCRGAFAEYACAGESNFLPKPPGLTFEQSAAVGVSAITALDAVRDQGKVQPGHEVLINEGGSSWTCEAPSIREKLPWWRGVRGPLRITGRRLDGPSPPLRAHIPDGTARPASSQPASSSRARAAGGSRGARMGRAWRS